MRGGPNACRRPRKLPTRFRGAFRFQRELAKDITFAHALLDCGVCSWQAKLHCAEVIIPHGMNHSPSLTAHAKLVYEARPILIGFRLGSVVLYLGRRGHNIHVLSQMCVDHLLERVATVA